MFSFSIISEGGSYLDGLVGDSETSTAYPEDYFDARKDVENRAYRNYGPWGGLSDRNWESGLANTAALYPERNIYTGNDLVDSRKLFDPVFPTDDLQRHNIWNMHRKMVGNELANQMNQPSEPEFKIPDPVRDSDYVSASDYKIPDPIRIS